MSADPVQSHLAQLVQSHPVVLFMKGTPSAPQCGFSYAVANVLEHYEVPVHAVNVLADPEIREGVKAFSNWPTIPQLYVKGEFVGGCDIVREMFQAGELQSFLVEKGVSVKGAA